MSVEKQGGIDATRITKPIQLLAAWLVGLIFVNTAFLLTATSFSEIEWLAAVLVISSVINVPLFLAAIFLLQTKFRPEMQEDHYYNEYMKDKLGRLKSEKAPLPKVVQKKSEIKDQIANEWGGITIMFNPHLAGSDKVKESLLSHKIPIHREFGSSHWISEFVVGIGRYLTYEQIGKILHSLEGTPANRISFANDDDEIYEWDKTVLIGSYAYDIEEKTFSLDEALTLYKQDNGDGCMFYQKIFDRQRDDEA